MQDASASVHLKKTNTKIFEGFLGVTSFYLCCFGVAQIEVQWKRTYTLQTLHLIHFPVQPYLKMSVHPKPSQKIGPAACCYVAAAGLRHIRLSQSERAAFLRECPGDGEHLSAAILHQSGLAEHSDQSKIPDALFS